MVETTYTIYGSTEWLETIMWWTALYIISGNLTKIMNFVSAIGNIGNVNLMFILKATWPLNLI